MKGQLKQNEIQTKQFNERTVNFARQPKQPNKKAFEFAWDVNATITMEGHLYLDARDANVTIKWKDSCSFERYKRNNQIKLTNLSCARFECNNQIKGQLKLRKIQTKQSNERTVKSKKNPNERKSLICARYKRNKQAK